MHFAITGFMGVLYPTCTTRIEHILRWGRERLQAVRRRRAPKLEAGFYRCQGWAGCIIATIWQPELLSQESLVEVEDELRVRCALKPALCALRSHNEPFPTENACQNDHQVRGSISFFSRVEFPRGTTAFSHQKFSFGAIPRLRIWFLSDLDRILARHRIRRPRAYWPATSNFTEAFSNPGASAFTSTKPAFPVGRTTTTHSPWKVSD